jgi:hypothetical protein
MDLRRELDPLIGTGTNTALYELRSTEARA